MDQNPPITAYEHDILSPLNLASLFAETSAKVIGGSEKRTCWLSLELQSLHVMERHSDESLSY